MIVEKKVANAMSGMTARACDCCIRKRARWYCAADDAFLCQSCDGSVHSANPLARRHERVRLKTASIKRSSSEDDPLHLPSWHRGLTRKARTPRHGKHSKLDENSNGGGGGHNNPLPPIVPELGAEDTTSQEYETEEQLLYRVPIFDPPVDEVEGFSDMMKSQMIKPSSENDDYLPLDMDFEEFAADVETLLGKGFDEESYKMEELGLLDCNNNNEAEEFVKVVKEENELGDHEVVIREPFELSFDYDENFPTTCEDHQEDEKVMGMQIVGSSNNGNGIGDIELCKLEGGGEEEEEGDKKVVKRRRILLRLDYDAISVAWASHGSSSPWLNGQRPEIIPDDRWPHFMGASGTGLGQTLYGENHQMGGGGNGGMGDGGREARVSRYREKRRTRLFSKKIRYEVRKLNAEKRPRMKGRFVKRSSASFAPATTAANTPTAFPLLSK